MLPVLQFANQRQNRTATKQRQAAKRRRRRRWWRWGLTYQDAGISVGGNRSNAEFAEADSGAVTPIQRFGSAANLNIHLHCLVLDGVYRCDTEGEPVFVEVPAPTDEALQTVLHKIITRLMK